MKIKGEEQSAESHPALQLRLEANRYAAALNSMSRRAKVTIHGDLIYVNDAPYSLEEIAAMRRHLESRAAIRW
jgi:hypothetical protein